ncbi:SRPBCC family protein [Bowmanella dokdonensis]|uniref:SRPBCC family protein n=1 Tax=Bowmanella dokdonensis TaxID=751969 RepID=A0A939DQA0_9ALTE|nr:SRPBCC family protein [Bowmanella dokdonensis]MBN7826822.1 SRPBCC family protein [Bowmanella dokdonensis]
MEILKKFIIATLVLVVILVGIGFILPSHFRVERDILIDAPPEKIYAQVVDLQKWQDWGVWFKRDPAMEVRYEGPQGEVGMKSVWSSESQGSGEMEVIATEENQRLVYRLYFPDFAMSSTGEIVLTQQDDRTKVLWKDYGEVGANPVHRYFALMMDSMVGPDFEMGLENLKTLVENSR